MKKISIETENSYSVFSEKGILGSAYELIKENMDINSDTRFFIITDDIVDALHFGKLEKSFRDSGVCFYRFVIRNGEDSKNLSVFSNIIAELSERNISRSDVIIAFGGGVVGDLAGFCAATYLRGIRYIQIPTTLLSAVDSSVGGKTAVNTSAGKNLVGAFYQPSMVIFDPCVFDTLSGRDFSSGMAEVIKYAVLDSRELFDFLERNTLGPDSLEISDVIFRCIEIKEKYVSSDEKDNGIRRMLNLGHTFGHAVEKISGYSFTHGESVSIGLSLICRYSYMSGFMAFEDYVLISLLLEKYSLPVACPYDTSELINTIKLDKKIRDGRLNLIIPEKIGKCSIVKTGFDEIERFRTKSKDEKNLNFGLLGHNISHSISPEIHSVLGKYRYSLFDTEPENLSGFFSDRSIDGGNITIPYKIDSMDFMDSISEKAREIGSVNTFIRMERMFSESGENRLFADNTDYFGFSRMVQDMNLDVSGKKVLILGSGGASKTAEYFMKENNAEDTVIISRTGKNSYDNIDLHFDDTDIIVNTTPVGMYPDIDRCPVDISQFRNLEAVIDLIYNPEETLLLKKAKELGLKYSNGMVMLYEQARAASCIFRLR